MESVSQDTGNVSSDRGDGVTNDSSDPQPQPAGHTHSAVTECVGGAQLLDSLITSTLQAASRSRNMAATTQPHASSSSSTSTSTTDQDNNVASPSAQTVEVNSMQDVFNVLSNNQHQNQQQSATQQQTAASTEQVQHQQTFHRIRQVLCFVIGIIIRLSLLTSFGAEYVQVSNFILFPSMFP